MIQIYKDRTVRLDEALRVRPPKNALPITSWERSYYPRSMPQLKLKTITTGASVLLSETCGCSITFILRIIKYEGSQWRNFGGTFIYFQLVIITCNWHVEERAEDEGHQRQTQSLFLIVYGANRSGLQGILFTWSAFRCWGCVFMLNTLWRQRFSCETDPSSDERKGAVHHRGLRWFSPGHQSWRRV